MQHPQPLPQSTYHADSTLAAYNTAAGLTAIDMQTFIVMINHFKSIDAITYVVHRAVRRNASCDLAVALDLLLPVAQLVVCIECIQRQPCCNSPLTFGRSACVQRGASSCLCSQLNVNMPQSVWTRAGSYLFV